MRAAITAIGMITSVGNDAAGSIAAVRAGISRPSPLRFPFFDDDALGEGVVYGHPIRGFTDGYEGVTLLATMGAHAVRDLLGSAKIPAGDRSWLRTALVVGASAYRSEELFYVTDLIRERLPAAILEGAGLQLPADAQRVVLEEHASAHVALAWAMGELSAGRVDRILIVCTDSLTRDVDLEHLAEADRLKTPDQPVGLEPGEGAAALLVESEAEVRRRGAAPLAWIEDVRTALDPEPRSAGHRGSGRALAEVLRACASGRAVGAVYADLNGETARAWEWGTALSLAAALDLPSAPIAVALSLGDTGAASSAIALAAAARSFQRGYAPPGACVVAASAESGRVGAAVLTSAAARGR